MTPDMIIRHSRQLLSGIHLQSDSDGSPPTNCGDDGPRTVVFTFSSFPTVVIGNPSPSYSRFPLRHSRRLRHSRAGGNPEHQRSIATKHSSRISHTKASHPTIKHPRTPCWMCRKDSPSVRLPNARALGPRLREDDGEKGTATMKKKPTKNHAPQISKKPSAKLPSSVISQIPSGIFHEPFILSCSHGELR